MQVSEIVEIHGHLIDSGSLSRVLDDITDYGGDYAVEQFDIGHGTGDPSYARIEVTADDEETLQRTLMRLQTHGVNQVDPGEAERQRGDGRRRLPRRLLLDHQPRDPGAPRRALGRGREPRDGLRSDRRQRRGPHPGAHPADVRRQGRHAGRLRRQRHQGDPAGRGRAPRAASGSWSPTSPARSRRRVLVRQVADGHAGGQGRRAEGPVGRRSRRRAHRRGAGDGRARRGRLRRRALRRQRARHPRHRVRALRHLPRRRPRRGVRASSTATSTTSARSTRSARPARSARPSTRAC